MYKFAQTKTTCKIRDYEKNRIVFGFDNNIIVCVFVL